MRPGPSWLRFAALAWAFAAFAAQPAAVASAGQTDAPPPLSPQQRADYAADGSRLAQARYCGYPHPVLGQLAEQSRAAAREAAASAGGVFNDAGYRDAFLDGARYMDEVLLQVDPASRERECARVRAQIEPSLGR